MAPRFGFVWKKKLVERSDQEEPDSSTPNANKQPSPKLSAPATSCTAAKCSLDSDVSSEQLFAIDGGHDVSVSASEVMPSPLSAANLSLTLAFLLQPAIFCKQDRTAKLLPNSFRDQDGSGKCWHGTSSPDDVARTIGRGALRLKRTTLNILPTNDNIDASRSVKLSDPFALKGNNSHSRFKPLDRIRCAVESADELFSKGRYQKARAVFTCPSASF